MSNLYSNYQLHHSFLENQDPNKTYSFLFTFIYQFCVYISMRVYVCAHTDCGPICRSENTVKESWVSGLVGSTFTFAAILPAQDPHIVFGYLFQSSLICIVSLLSFLYLIGENRTCYFSTVYILQLVQHHLSLSVLPIRW